VTVYSKYAKYLEDVKRRETWSEIVDRSMWTHLRKFESYSNEFKMEIVEAFEMVRNKMILPSMRFLQFAGKPIELSPARGFNCSYCPVDKLTVFNEAMFLLLMGCGFGYSVQLHHIAKLPPLVGPLKPNGKTRKKRYLINDSIEGWADTIKMLIESYFYGKNEVEFDYRDIRPKGARLVTSGGKAPGPQPLKDCVHNIRKVLDNALMTRGSGTHLTSIEAHDILCYISDAVLAGGIRRAASISFFSFDDAEMMACKSGNWFETNPQRGRANNSVVLVRHKIKEEEFKDIFEKIKASKCGEPGIYFTNDKDMLSNPCAEASLKPRTFCNLVTINLQTVKDQADFNARCRAASFIGTLQASYTDFHYLGDEWRENTEKDALLGVSMTGIANKTILDTINFEEGALSCKKENARVAKIIGINKAARITNIKPEGTASCVLGTSSGIHAWHSDKYYIRRMRVGKKEALYKYLIKHCPGILEDEFFRPDTDAVMSFPVEVPEGSISRKETAIELLERIKKFYKEWITPGHRKGSNKHSISATVTIKDNEWEEVGEWMWNNRETYAGLSVLPYDETTYVQMPFEECDESTYNKLIQEVKDIDISNIIEEEDTVDHKGEVACAGGACEITSLKG